jgi:hypothetical protein
MRGDELRIQQRKSAGSQSGDKVNKRDLAGIVGG